MTVEATLLIVGMIAGGLACAGLGLSMRAASRGDQWMAGYQAGKLAGSNEAQPVAQPPAPVIIVTQPQPVAPATIDAAWRPVEPARQFVVIGESEQPRRLTGGVR